MSSGKLAVPVSIMFCVLVLGCTSQGNLEFFNISRPNDDGSAYVIISFLPETIGGLASGFEGSNVGYIASEERLYRAFYRFDIANWRGNDLKLHLSSGTRTGDPGSIGFYVIDDFGSLSEIEGADVSFYWGLDETGILAEETSFQEGWFEINIPRNIVESKRTEAGFLAIMAKLSNETRMVNGAYNLISYEQANYIGSHGPHLTEAY